MCCVYKPGVSKLHPAGALSYMKIASLEISSMGIIENNTFFSKGGVVLSTSMNLCAFRIFTGIHSEYVDFYIRTSQPELQD